MLIQRGYINLKIGSYNVLRYVSVDSIAELIILKNINKKIITRKEGRVDFIYILNQFTSVAKKYCV